MEYDFYAVLRKQGSPIRRGNHNGRGVITFFFYCLMCVMRLRYCLRLKLQHIRIGLCLQRLRGIIAVIFDIFIGWRENQSLEILICQKGL